MLLPNVFIVLKDITKECYNYLYYFAKFAACMFCNNYYILCILFRISFFLYLHELILTIIKLNLHFTQE